jgi:hypothetical protein
MGCEDAVVADEVEMGWGDEGGELLEELVGGDEELAGAGRSADDHDDRPTDHHAMPIEPAPPHRGSRFRQNRASLRNGRMHASRRSRVNPRRASHNLWLRAPRCQGLIGHLSLRPARERA